MDTHLYSLIPRPRMQGSGDTQEKSLEAIQYVIYKNVCILQTALFDKRWYLWLRQITF